MTVTHWACLVVAVLVVVEVVCLLLAVVLG